MAKQIIDIGSAPNDGTGDKLRDAFDKTKDNFDELYDVAVEPEYFYFTGQTFRIGVRDAELCIDQTITATGFDGEEDTDWEKLTGFKIP